jgi:predicted DNA-binding protein YlxM (UPF0122 family)
MIIFTHHSLAKLQQRNIKKSAVVETIKNPNHIIKTYGNRIVIFKKFDKLYLKVVFKKEKKNTIIITQHWTRKLI